MQTPHKEKTVGSQLLVLFKLALPIIIGNFAYAILGITDIMMAGMAGTPDQAGVAIGGSFFFPAITFIIGLVSALHPVISRYCGANSHHEIPQAHAHAMVSCLIFGVLIMGILLILSQYFIEMDTDKRMEEVTIGYVNYIAFTMPIAALFTSSRAYCEAMGNTKTTLYFGLLAVILNVPLNYALIFGKFGLPELGGIGCGLATLISMALSLVAILFYMALHPQLKHYSWLKNKNGVKLQGIKDYIKLALPLGISSSVECSCFTMIALLLSPLGPIAVSSNTITMSLTSFVFNIHLSVGIATSIMVGYAIGQNNLNTLKLNIKAAYASMLICIILSVGILLGGRDYLPKMFSRDPEVLAFVATFLIFASINQIFESIQTIQAFILRGFKDTKTILAVTFVAFYCVALPIGISLCYGYLPTPFNLEGPTGFWIGLFLGLVSAATLYRFRVLHHYRKLKHDLMQELQEKQASEQSLVHEQDSTLEQNTLEQNTLELNTSNASKTITN